MLAPGRWTGLNYSHGMPLRDGPVSLGLADHQDNLLDDMDQFCDSALPQRSIYALLHRERGQPFPGSALRRPVRRDRAALGATLGCRDGDGAPAPFGHV